MARDTGKGKTTRKKARETPPLVLPEPTPSHEPVLQGRNDGTSPGVVLLSSVLGALSILSLNDELKLVKITKHITRWVRDYAELVGKLRDLLFGWIDLGWISITRDEMHVLVLSALLASTSFRAHRREPELRAYKERGKISTPTEMAVLVFLPPLFFALVLPGKGGIWVSGILLGMMVVMLVMSNDPDKPPYYPSRRSVHIELAGTLALVVLAVALSRVFE